MARSATFALLVRMQLKQANLSALPVRQAHMLKQLGPMIPTYVRHVHLANTDPFCQLQARKVA